MSQNSQDLAKKIAQQMEKQQILQTSLTALQKQWDDQKKQIADDTKVAIEISKKAQLEAIRDSKKELITIQKEVQDLVESKEKHLLYYNAVIEKTNQELEGLDRDKKILITFNDNLLHENRELASQIAVAREEIDDLLKGEQSLKETIMGLETSITGLNSEKDELDDSIASKTGDLEQINNDFTDKKAELDNQISILELKKQDLEQFIMDNQTQQDKVRENLAVWENRLAEKDKNLRIREAKVDQKEKSLIRNYELLNL